MPAHPTPASADRHCLIVGAGPAGMMLGLLLARTGLQVEVLEKPADFLRDFRGNTIHSPTLEVMHEPGLLGQFLERQHQKTSTLPSPSVTQRSGSPISATCRRVAASLC